MAELTEERVREIVREELGKAAEERRVFPEPIQKAFDEVLADLVRVMLKSRPVGPPVHLEGSEKMEIDRRHTEVSQLEHTERVKEMIKREVVRFAEVLEAQLRARGMEGAEAVKAAGQRYLERVAADLAEMKSRRFSLLAEMEAETSATLRAARRFSPSASGAAGSGRSAPGGRWDQGAPGCHDRHDQGALPP